MPCYSNGTPKFLHNLVQRPASCRSRFILLKYIMDSKPSSNTIFLARMKKFVPKYSHTRSIRRHSLTLPMWSDTIMKFETTELAANSRRQMTRNRLHHVGEPAGCFHDAYERAAVDFIVATTSFLLCKCIGNTIYSHISAKLLLAVGAAPIYKLFQQNAVFVSG
jgi:hypothetical protein